MNSWVGRASAIVDRRIAILSGPDEATALGEIVGSGGGEASRVEPAELVAGIRRSEFGAALVTVDALARLDIAALDDALRAQAPWSDFPFLLLADRDMPEAAFRQVAELGNVSIVERPVDAPILRKAVKAALRARERQREAEAYLLQRESAEEHLRQLTATLENRVRDRMGDLRAANQRLVREMDERKGAEARLRESEELYRYTVELTRQMAWTANPDGSMVTVSQRFYDMTGSDPSLLPHEAWLQVIHPDDLELVNARWERSLATGEDHVVAFRMRVADGSYRVCRARAAPRRDESGRIIRWYGYTEDIHERQQMEAARQEAEERLRESEELYRQTVELSQGIVWTAAADGAFESMTRRYWDLTGMEPGTLPRNAIHPDDRERVLGEWANAIATGTPHNTEYRLRLADGSYRQYRARAAPRRDEHGQIVRWYGLLEDIDEQKQSERAQEEAEAEIRRVQSELIHVSRLSAMGAMASALAHELNQPLTAVSSYLRGSRRLLQQVSDPTVDKVMDALQAAEEGALRAGQMVRRLRELVSRGSVSTRAEHLPKLIQDANTIGFVDEMLFGVTHKVELDPAAEWVEVDPIQIQQVLINLIRNAIQAMEDQPRREISITTRASSRNTAEVSVADTGCGIPEEVREALFSPFQSSKADGMGIGLSISRTIIEAHGGKIWAEDREGGGTVFRFTLRIADAPDAREEGEAAA